MAPISAPRHFELRGVHGYVGLDLVENDAGFLARVLAAAGQHGEGEIHPVHQFVRAQLAESLPHGTADELHPFDADLEVGLEVGVYSRVIAAPAP